MADQPRRPRTLNDARTEAEAAFKRTTTKVVEAPPKPTALPGVKELVSLRIDQDVLEHFQEGGAGWQDRINEALRRGRGQIDPGDCCTRGRQNVKLLEGQVNCQKLSDRKKKPGTIPGFCCLACLQGASGACRPSRRR